MCAFELHESARGTQCRQKIAPLLIYASIEASFQQIM